MREKRTLFVIKMALEVVSHGGETAKKHFDQRTGGGEVNAVDEISNQVELHAKHRVTAAHLAQVQAQTVRGSQEAIFSQPDLGKEPRLLPPEMRCDRVQQPAGLAAELAQDDCVLAARAVRLFNRERDDERQFFAELAVGDVLQPVGQSV